MHTNTATRTDKSRGLTAPSAIPELHRQATCAVPARTLPAAVVADEDAATRSQPLEELDKQRGLVRNVQQGVPGVDDVKGRGREVRRGHVLLLELDGQGRCTRSQPAQQPSVQQTSSTPRDGTVCSQCTPTNNPSAHSHHHTNCDQEGQKHQPLRTICRVRSALMGDGQHVLGQVNAQHVRTKVLGHVEICRQTPHTQAPSSERQQRAQSAYITLKEIIAPQACPQLREGGWLSVFWADFWHAPPPPMPHPTSSTVSPALIPIFSTKGLVVYMPPVDTKPSPKIFSYLPQQQQRPTGMVSVASGNSPNGGTHGAHARKRDHGR
jgi:hypothetical protein